MSITQESVEFKAKVQGMLGEKFELLANDMEGVRNSGVIDHALKVGDSAPAFVLPDAFGKEVSSEKLLAQGPVVVSFYRGEWCPFCNIELRGQQAALPEMEAMGATLVAISPELPDHGIVISEKNQLTFPVLSDAGNEVARQFGIVFKVSDEIRELSKNAFQNDIAVKNGDDSYELPVPATFVIDRGGVIRFAHVNVDYMTGRAEPEEILAVLKGI